MSNNRLLIEDKMDTMNDYLRKISFAIGGEVSKPNTWEEIRILCRNNKIKGLLEIGETREFVKDGEKISAVVMDFIENGKHSDGLRLRDGLQTGVIFQCEKILYTLQFDEREAFYCAVDGLPAGTYNFTVGEHSWLSSEVGKTYQFTLTKAVPVGGQLVWKQAHNATLNNGGIDVFSDGNSRTAMETVTMTEGSEGTSLGTIINSLQGNFNSCQRALLGSNNYKESAIRQYLNSDAIAGEVWTAQTKFDRPPSWFSSTKGFLNGVEQSLIDNIVTIDRSIYRNTVTDGGGLDEISEKIFLPSRNEIYMTQEGADNTLPFAYYRDNSVSAVAYSGNDTCRIKNNKNGQATYWWLESPYAGNARSVRVVSPDGADDSYGANYSCGVAPAFIIA